MQTLRVIDGQSVAITSSFQIIAEGGAQNSVAQILQAEIDALISGTVTIHPLSALDDNASQIVIGDTTNAAIDSLAAAHKRSTRNLGPEGYNLIALPNPGSTNGSWRILIVANSREGLIHGVFTLSDLIAGGTPGSVDNVRVRDYPDRPLRDLQHWVPSVTGSAWVSARTQEFRDMASYGANSVSLGRSDFYRMDRPVSTGTFGSFLKQTVDAAPNYGVEPNTEITFPTPDVGLFPDGWKWREGEFVQDEPFVIVDSLGALVLRPVHPNFDNVAHNMSFDSLSAGVPFAWNALDGGWGQTGYWGFTNVSGAVEVSQVGPAPIVNGVAQARLEQVIHTRDGGDLEPSSLYVLKVAFSNVHYDSSVIQIMIYGKYAVQLPPGVPALDPGVFGPGAYSLIPSQSPWWYLPAFKIRNSDPQRDPEYPKYTEYYYFWTPPTQAEADSLPGYSGATFDSTETISIQIGVYGYDPTETVTIQEMSLERRASTLSNVMYLPASSVPDGTDPLDFTVRLADGTPVPSSAYTVAYHRPADYRMESPDSITTVYWQDTQVADSGSTVLASFTVGVPDDYDPRGGNQATTYCLRSPGYQAWIDSLLSDLYAGPYAFSPRYLTARLDEFRGMNRCERDFRAQRTNAQYLIDHIIRIQGQLDALSATHPAAGETRLIMMAQNLPANKGILADYQFSWGGPWGAMVATTELQALAGTNAKVVSPVSFQYATTVRYDNQWPGQYLLPGQSNVMVAGRMIGNIDTVQVAEKAKMATWYEDDGIGFLVANNNYNDNTIHFESEYRLLDYAWKRYRNPDAALIARRGGVYVTDDAVGDTATVFPTDSLEFEYFASSEVRDPANTDTLLASATIDWGDGSPVASVFDPSDRTRVQGSVSHAWFYGDHIVTLSVTTQGGASRSVTIPVHVDIYGDPNTTVWSTDTTISDTVRVEVGKVMIIEPGTNVTVGPNPSGGPVWLHVYGALGIMGTAANPVTFAYTDTTNMGGWSSIFVKDSASALIEHCDYRNANSGLACDGNLTIRNSTIRDCARLGLSIAGADSVYARNVTIRNIPPGYDGLSIGINLLGTARLRADSCTVDNAYDGILVYGQAKAHVNDTMIRGGVQAGMWVFGHGELTARVCQTDSCAVGLKADSTAVSATQCTFQNGTAYAVLTQNTTASVTIDSCTIINHDVGVYVSAVPNVTISNNTISACSNDDIYLLAGSNGSITGNTISGGTVGINLDASNALVVGNTIDNASGGIHCDAASPNIKRNRIANSTYGITTANGADPWLDHCGGACPSACADANSIVSTVGGYRVSNLDPVITIDARCNYWGKSSGRNGVGSSSFYGLVDWKPYLTTDPLPSSPAGPGRDRLPTSYGLSQGYPNPFNPTVTIPYQVPPPGGKVSIRVYNVKGQLVTTLVDGPTNPGYRRVVWEGTGRRGNPVSSGVYFVQMLGPRFKRTRKVVLLK